MAPPSTRQRCGALQRNLGLLCPRIHGSYRSYLRGHWRGRPVALDHQLMRSNLLTAVEEVWTDFGIALLEFRKPELEDSAHVVISLIPRSWRLRRRNRIICTLLYPWVRPWSHHCLPRLWRQATSQFLAFRLFTPVVSRYVGVFIFAKESVSLHFSLVVSTCKKLFSQRFSVFLSSSAPPLLSY